MIYIVEIEAILEAGFDSFEVEADSESEEEIKDFQELKHGSYLENVELEIRCIEEESE